MGQVNGQTSINDFLYGLLEQQPTHQRKKAAKPAKSKITKETRRESHEKTAKQPLKQLVLDTLKGKELTAREIATEMHKSGLLPYPARAIIQPRITELLETGDIEVTGSKLDTATNRKVAVYKVSNNV